MVSQLYFLFLLGLSINSPPHKQRYKKMTTTAFYQERLTFVYVNFGGVIATK